MIERTKNWFGELTPKLKQLTIVFAFIVALSSVWGVLKAFGVDALDWTIGCSSFSSQTEKNTMEIQRMKIADSIDKYWKGIRRTRDSAAVEKRFLRLEKKAGINVE